MVGDYLEVVLDLIILGSTDDFDSFTMVVVSSLLVQPSAEVFVASDSTVA